MWVRDSKRTGIEEVFARVKEIAKGAAIIAGVESKVTVQTGDYEILVNLKGAQTLQKISKYWDLSFIHLKKLLLRKDSGSTRREANRTRWCHSSIERNQGNSCRRVNRCWRY